MTVFEPDQLVEVSATVNGESVTALTSSRTLLSDFLRHDLRLTGTHVGCEHGACGACTVIVDGAAIRSCLMLAAQIWGADVTTVEGLAIAEDLHPLQQTFWEEHGLQCGFCTPGILCTLHAVTDHDQEDLGELLNGHICRCTGYQSIRRAIEAYFGRGTGSEEQHES